jgi:hypothetical protein
MIGWGLPVHGFAGLGTAGRVAAGQWQGLHALAGVGRIREARLVSAGHGTSRRAKGSTL